MISINNEEKMKLAIEMAREALNKGEIPIGAVIFLEDEVIAKSYTSEMKDKRYLVHAEIKALMEADGMGIKMKDRRKMQLFTTLEPCMMCLGGAMSFCIGEIYYALEAPGDGAVELARQKWARECKEYPGYKVPEVYGGVLRDESRELFREYINIHDNSPVFVRSLAEL